MGLTILTKPLRMNETSKGSFRRRREGRGM